MDFKKKEKQQRGVEESSKYMFLKNFVKIKQFVFISVFFRTRTRT